MCVKLTRRAALFCTLALAACSRPEAQPEHLRAGYLYETPRALAPVASTPPDARWYDTEWGWILSASLECAENIAQELRASAAAFYRYFGVRPGPGAVIENRFAPVAGQLRAKVEWLLPWSCASAPAPKASSWRASAVAEQLVENGLAAPTDNLINVVEIGLRGARDPSPGSGAGHNPDPATALRHELNHVLFIRYFIPNTRGLQYGGNAPDWLDEASAIVAETPHVTRSRRESFKRLVAKGQLTGLDIFLSAPHPLFANKRVVAAIERARSGPAKSGAVVLPPGALGDAGQKALAFYAETRGLVDFLIQSSGDERILMHIAKGIKRYGSFDRWLMAEGAAVHLPSNVTGLDGAFRTWATRQAGER